MKETGWVTINQKQKVFFYEGICTGIIVSNELWKMFTMLRQSVYAELN